MSADHKSLETVILIAICRQLVDKWGNRKLFLTILDLRSSIIVLTFLIVAYAVCLLNIPNRYPKQSETRAMNNLHFSCFW